MIHFCLITDDGYADMTKNCINSILRSKNYDTEISFHLILKSVSDANKAKLKALPGTIIYDASKWIEQIEQFPACVHVNNTALLKFYIPEILTSLSKVVYIDGDTYVCRDLSPVYNTDIGSNYVAAVKDFGLLTVWRHESLPNVKENRYFQSSLMVMNLPLMRSTNLAAKLMECKQEKYFNKGCMDQDVLNDIIQDRAVYLPPKYCVPIHKMILYGKEFIDINLINKTYGTTYKNMFEYILDAAILHFHGSKQVLENNPYLKDFLVYCRRRDK